MGLTKNAGRIDHVVISVYPDSFRPFVDRLSKALGISFMEYRREESGLMIALSWDAGLEVVAPMQEKGRIWERLKEKGEGSVAIVFGVENLEDAVRRAEAAGVGTGPEIGLLGDEPWADMFGVLREKYLAGPLCGATIVLGQIEPKPPAK
jgi:hypothetical protein